MGSPPRIRTPAEPAPWIALAILGLMVVGLHAVPGPARNLWGLHLYAFLPRAALPIGLAVLAIGVFLAIRSVPPVRIPSRGDPDLPSGGPGLTRALLVVAGAVIAFALFWMFRIRHRFLGDAMVLVQDIPRPGEVHALEPVAMALQRNLYAASHAWFDQPGRTQGDVAHLTTALGSALAGVLFVFTAIEISRQLVRAVDRPATDAGTAGLDLRVVLTAFVLLAQGYIQLFFGYVENYTFLALAIGYYVATALAFLNGRGGLLPVVLASSVATCLHLSAAALAPSLAVLLVLGLVSPDLRVVIRRDVVPTLVLLVAIGLLLGSMGDGYDFVTHLTSAIRSIVTGETPTGPYLFTPAHLRDIVNLQLLIGPVGLAALIVLLPGLRQPSANRRVRVFLLALAGTFALVAVIAGDSNLGYARNWDLLAPAGIPFTVTALFLLLDVAPQRARLERALAIAGLVSLFHTVSWVALNASLERSLERFKTLPLGAGRTESTVGYWYVCQGRPDLAEPWLQLALRENPANARAWMWLGHACMMSGRTREAADHFVQAVAQRPDVTMFRLSLINCLVLAHQSAAALNEAHTLVRTEPSAARAWAVLGTVLLTLGRSDEAREAFERASLLEPRAPIYAELLKLASAPGGIQPILDRYWAVLTL